MTTDIEYPKKLLKNMTPMTILKFVGASLLTFLLPLKGLFILILIVVLLDMFTGIKASKKLGDKITSNKLFNTIVKLGFYFTITLVAYLIDVFVFNGTTPIIPVANGLSKGIALFVIGIEAMSIDENSQRLGNQPFTVLFKKMITFLSSAKKDLVALSETEKKDKENENKDEGNVEK